jgi:hypothetical protein
LAHSPNHRWHDLQSAIDETDENDSQTETGDTWLPVLAALQNLLTAS